MVRLIYRMGIFTERMEQLNGWNTNISAYSERREQRRRAQTDNESHNKARALQIKMIGQHHTHRDIEQKIAAENYRHNDLDILQASKHTNRKTLNAIRELIDGNKQHQLCGELDDLGIIGKYLGYRPAEGYKDKGHKGCPDKA